MEIKFLNNLRYADGILMVEMNIIYLYFDLSIAQLLFIQLVEVI